MSKHAARELRDITIRRAWRGCGSGTNLAGLQPVLQQRFQHVDQVAFAGGIGAHDVLPVKILNRVPLEHGLFERVEQAGGMVLEDVGTAAYRL